MLSGSSLKAGSGSLLWSVPGLSKGLLAPSSLPLLQIPASVAEPPLAGRLLGSLSSLLQGKWSCSLLERIGREN